MPRAGLSGTPSGVAVQRALTDFMKMKLFVAGGVILLLLLACEWPLHVLALKNARDGRWVFARVVSPGDVFTLSYIHSVKRKEVKDFYVIDQEYEIIQNKTVFPDSDFGLPSRAVGTETYTLQPDGNGCISGMHRLIPSLLLRVEKAYDNTLTINETPPINLSQRLGNCVVELRVHSMNPIRYAFQATMLYGE